MNFFPAKIFSGILEKGNHSEHKKIGGKKLTEQKRLFAQKIALWMDFSKKTITFITRYCEICQKLLKIQSKTSKKKTFGQKIFYLAHSGR